MMASQFISGFLLFASIAIYSCDELDYTSLMQKYYLLCGPDYFCLEPNITHQFDIVPQDSYRHLGLCPDCWCDYACVRRGDCCPDVFFKFPKQQCVNRTIIHGWPDSLSDFLHSMHDQRFSELMVTTCPEGSDRILRDKCERDTDVYYKLQNFPVTSKHHFALTYVNIYCAQCHGVKDVLSWSLDISCLGFADFNFLSTLDEIIHLAYNRYCIFQAYIQEKDLPITVNPEICYKSDTLETKRLYTKCNETRLWQKFDPAIHSACESRFHGEIRVFKNVFCYMCNPSIHKDFVIIDRCNVTGQWDSLNADLRQACTKLPENQATTPYKNIFCYLCNKRTNRTGLFEDVNASLTEDAISHHHFRFRYFFTITAFDITYFRFIVNSKIDEHNELGTPVVKPFSVDTMKLNTDLSVNLSNILHMQLSMDDSSYMNFGVCKGRSSLFEAGLHIHSLCTCDIPCIFKKLNFYCCADLLIEQPTRCISREELSNYEDPSKDYLVINGCLQEYTFEVYKQFCSTTHFGDIYSTLPLNLAGTDVSYNNLYCAMCNLESETYIKKMQGINITSTNGSEDPLTPLNDYKSSEASYDPWNIEVVCTLYLDFSYYHNLGGLLETAKAMKCLITYNTTVRESEMCRSLDKTGKSTCANFANWTYMNLDVEWACNNVIYNRYRGYYMEIEDLPIDKFDVSWYKHYRDSQELTNSYSNIYCAVCKPIKMFETRYIEKCNATGFWEDYNDVVEFRCLNLPPVFYYYPFKNAYCAKCNGISLTMVSPGTDGPVPPWYKPIFGVTWFPVLRNLFSISEDTQYSPSSNEDACSSHQQFDEYTVIITLYYCKIV